jgi:hypothetical protein
VAEYKELKFSEMNFQEWVEYLQAPASPEQLAIIRAYLINLTKVRAIREGKLTYHETAQHIDQLGIANHCRLVSDHEKGWFALFFNKRATDQECMEIFRLLQRGENQMNLLYLWDGIEKRALGIALGNSNQKAQ